ncbi:MAG TPA: hypothetical protein VHB50_08995, partial [Bryobacteraceae bacterium]|nr:hypothetical protein [Bryobacteraceae bacterium]
SQRADGEWMLTKATEPVRTRNPKESSPDELKALAAQSPGAHTFRLMDATAANTHPPAHHKVVAKGFLIRQPGDDRINTSDLQSIAPSCSDR